MLQWLEKLKPTSKFSRKVALRSDSGDGMALISLRRHQQMLKEQRDVESVDLAGPPPPPVPPRCDEDYEEFEEMMEEEYDDEDQLDLGKLVEVLRSNAPKEGKNPDAASPGPSVSKKKVRWVKKKVRRRKKVVEGDDVVPPPPRAASSSVSSPALTRHGGPNKPPPPPPPGGGARQAVPDYPHEDMSGPLIEKMKELSELVTKTQVLYDGYKVIDKELEVKINALNQLLLVLAVGMKK